MQLALICLKYFLGCDNFFHSFLINIVKLACNKFYCVYENNFCNISNKSEKTVCISPIQSLLIDNATYITLQASAVCAI